MPIHDDHNHRTCPTSGTASCRRCFTLIELLVVITLLAILVALAVTAARFVSDQSSRKQVLANQAIIMKAVQVFIDTNNKLPADSNAPYAMDDASVTGRSSNLYGQLRGGVTGPILQGLTGSCMSTSNGVFVDAWGTMMDYQSRGGLGGAPVIISAGPDRVFGTSDDIRSDGKGPQ